VLGTRTAELPANFAALSALVAGLLFAAAYLVAARAGLVRALGPRWVHRVGVPVVGGVLLLRATVMGFVQSGFHLSDTSAVYERWDLMLYSPLCLTLGVLAFIVARRGPVATADPTLAAGRVA
jgi:hypothetical protein